MLRDQLRENLKLAMKNRDSLATSTLRMVTSTLKERDRVQVAEQGKSPLSDAEIMQMLQTMIKQRHESVRAYQDGGRDDLVAKEQAEIDILQGFLPKALSDEDVHAAIDAIIAEIPKQDGALPKSAMGQVIGKLKAQYPGQIDMGKAAGLVKARLSAS